jgi:hypothetical protein
MVLRTLLREPLLHFLAIGVAIFLVSAVLEEEEATPPIVVTQGRVEQLVEAFRRTWQRPPTLAELDGLVADFVREEIYYREAVLQGLDRDDTIVRRRMRQKMEFLATLQAENARPEEAELIAFHQEHPELFREPPEFAFLQVFVNTEKRGAGAEAVAVALLEELRLLAEPRQALELGDTTLLPAEIALSPLDFVGRTFGAAFVEVLATLQPESWEGPLRSAYGLHLVFVLERKDGGVLPFAEVGDAVAYQWRRALERRVLNEQYEALARKYRVVLEAAP